MSKPILFVDVDGVVADSHSWWIARYNADHGTKHRVEDITEWNTVKSLGVDLSPYFDDYSGVLPIKDALFSLSRLGNLYRIVFATAGLGENWVRTWYGDKAEVYRIQDKGLLRGYALIDDSPMNLDVFVGERFLFKQPWNQGRGLNEVTWEEITSYLVEVAHETFGNRY